MSGLQIIQILMRELSILCKFTRAVVHRTILCRICIAFLDQCGDHIDHTLNLIGRQRMCRGGLYIHGSHVLFALFNIAFGDHRSIHALLVCLFDDLIIHVGKV